MESADKKLLSKYYSLLFFVGGIPLTVASVMGLFAPDAFKKFYLWLLLATGVVGIIIEIYINVSKRFIVFERNTDST